MPAVTVWVTEFANRRTYQLQWIDATTGRKRTRSSSVERTGRQRERRLAERAAQELATELAAGGLGEDITWRAFRQLYEDRALPGLAPNTAAKVRTVLNGLERILPKVASGKLRDLTAERLGHYQAELRKLGRAEDTILGHSAHLRSALRWAVDNGLLPMLPKVRRPKRAKKSGGSSPMKGRPITGEEFERMLAVVPKVVVVERQGAVTDEHRAADAADIADWQHYLRGLWASGLRLAESLELFWDRPDKLCVDLSGKFPMLRIPAGLEKGHRDRLLAIAPEFAEFLLATPEGERRGRVFRLLSRRSPGSHLTKDRVSRMVCRIGKAAGVKVAAHTVLDPSTGEEVEKITYASCHDLRRSFGERWALRVPTPVLQELMRHENIATTLRYYVGTNANRTAEVVWAAFSGKNGNSFGNTPEQDSQNGVVKNVVTGFSSMS